MRGQSMLRCFSSMGFLGACAGGMSRRGVFLPRPRRCPAEPRTAQSAHRSGARRSAFPLARRHRFTPFAHAVRAFVPCIRAERPSRLGRRAHERLAGGVTPMPLSDTAMRKTKPATKRQKLADGGGLYLLLNPNGSRWWRLKYRVGGKEKLLSLGTYPDTGLKDVREKRDNARKLLAAGCRRRSERTAQGCAGGSRREVGKQLCCRGARMARQAIGDVGRAARKPDHVANEK